MKRYVKRVVFFLMAMVLFISIVPYTNAASVCFTAINDKLLELASDTMPEYVNGVMYVPISVFNSSAIRVYSTYNSTEQLATISKDDKLLTFDLGKSRVYDSKSTFYSQTAVTLNSRVYVPVSFVCGFFGLTYSYISSSSIAPIVRIKDYNVVLSDTKFVEAAESLMAYRLNLYNRTTLTQTNSEDISEPKQPVEQNGVIQQNNQTTDKTYENITVYLSFGGIDSNYMSQILADLQNYGYKVTFFVSAQELTASNCVNIVEAESKGHNFGVYSPTQEEVISNCKDAASRLAEAVKIKTVLAAANIDDELRDAGLLRVTDVSFESLNMAQTTAKLTSGSTRIYINMTVDETTADNLNFLLAVLQKGKYNVSQLNELTLAS